MAFFGRFSFGLTRLAGLPSVEQFFASGESSLVPDALCDRYFFNPNQMEVVMDGNLLGFVISVVVAGVSLPFALLVLWGLAMAYEERKREEFGKIAKKAAADHFYNEFMRKAKALNSGKD